MSVAIVNTTISMLEIVPVLKDEVAVFNKDNEIGVCEEKVDTIVLLVAAKVELSAIEIASVFDEEYVTVEPSLVKTVIEVAWTDVMDGVCV